MPTYARSEDWLLQSSLLLEARPETTRITTRYTIRPNVRRTKKPSSSDPPTTATAATTPPKSAGPPRGHLELKTYDPVSGACLKYRTVKLAEVGRLMQLLGNKLARTQAGLPVGGEEEAGAEDAVMQEGVDGQGQGQGQGGSGVATPVGGDKAAAGGAGGGGGGGKGKKKKGKR